MPKFNVRMEWLKFIDFGEIEASSKEEAEEKAQDLLDSQGDGQVSLTEEQEEPKFIVEESK